MKEYQLKLIAIKEKLITKYCSMGLYSHAISEQRKLEKYILKFDK